MTKFNFPKLFLFITNVFNNLILAFDKDENDGLHFVIFIPHTKSKWVVDFGDQG
jgi:hypothetical protein